MPTNFCNSLTTSMKKTEVNFCEHFFKEEIPSHPFNGLTNFIRMPASEQKTAARS